MENTEESSPLRNGDAFTVVVKKLPEKEFVESADLVQSSSRTRVIIKQLLSISSSNRLNKRFEDSFFWVGSMVSKYPVPVLLLSMLLAGLGCAGLPFLHQENDAIKLWIPQESDFSKNYAWLWSNHPPEFREHSIIIHGDNVLTPEGIQKMYEIYKSVYNIRTEKFNKTWEDVCFRIPVVKLNKLLSRRKRDLFEEEEDPFGFDDFEEEFSAPADFSVGNYPQPYCDMLSNLDTLCFQETLLELWAHEGAFTHKSESQIGNLTEEEILEKLNDWQYSELYLRERDFRPMLGGVSYDEEGRVVGAKAAYIKWMGRMNSTMALKEGGSDSAGTGEMVDRETEEFENALTQILLSAREIHPTELKVEIKVANSFGQIASATIWGDVSNLILGFSIVFIYVNFMLGRFNLVEQRGFLSLMGLGSVGMAIGFSYGICSVLGLAYGPLHNIIPFLLLGIGIDDMFVTTTCFSNLPEEPKGRSIQQRFGETMRSAGCAITVTSITDFIAFIIGGTTVLPALKSFCIFCAVGLLIVYLFQATWFVAWFSLDQRRIESKRDGMFFCHVHQNYTPNKLSQINFLREVFKKIADFILLKPVKVVLIVITSAILGVSVWGNICLRQEFNPIWFLPPESYLAQWHQHNTLFFPSQGEQVTIFMGALDLPQELEKVDRMHRELAEQSDIVASFDSWYMDYQEYVTNNFLKDTGRNILDLSDEEFRSRFTQFLYSPSGSKHRFLFKFDSPIECGEPASNFQLSMMTFRHIMMTGGPTEQIPAMNRVKKIINDANFSARVFPMAQGYASWETDEVISVELYRNLLLALGCIFITTWILLFNLWACLQVLMCVVLTLANVGGFMHFWGLTIDTVSCTNLIISIGLCVDYSAHIAHAYLHNKGTRNAKVKLALSNIGPAVLNGGFSTLLAFILLAGSRSHVFQSFFKIFFLVVIFGLYNGLIVLPIVLSIVGPRGSESETPAEAEEPLPESVPFKPILKTGAVGSGDEKEPQL